MNAQVNNDQGSLLLQIARASIASRFGLWFDCRDDADFLYEKRACFVTLMLSGRLRGCIGSLQAHRRLLDDVRENAQAAAFRDPRFQPLTANEYTETAIEVSLLSPLSPLEVENEQDAMSQLQPGVDGVVLQSGSKRGTFLPQVWESLPDPRQFLAELKRKAGLSTEYWSDDVRLFRYHVDKWTER
ncbi:MAG: AmmeMemoRadiSam system protein A [Betaproteobacteria bacterium]|nr:MAG: AmmeMemoRadiSam system protein A [Betaproteobacteria bacterium]